MLLNMKQRLRLLFIAALLLPLSGMLKAQTKTIDSLSVQIPIAGNSWQKPVESKLLHASEGLLPGLTQGELKTFVRFAAVGSFRLQIALGAVQKPAQLSVTVLQQKFQLAVKPSDSHRLLDLGLVGLQDTGYLAIVLSSVSGELPGVKAYQIAGQSSLIKSARYVVDNTDNFYYWGRRGPSVHLGYAVPVADDIEYFYNEVTVPQASDVIGSYFMANGFAEGYFGMQVNSAQERRILFSVWSPFTTDDPKEIPEAQRIILVKKGAGVHAGEFGNEGSGGQSYMRYNWQAGQTYKFLLRGRPVADNYTEYTAWFFAPEEGAWKFVAQFLRPNTQTYLKRFHSFLENFIPSQGDLERQVNFSNQWVCDVNGNWHACEEAKFTADATARKQYRMDYGGGINKDAFYLRNAGFFSDYTAINSQFKLKSKGQKPLISLAGLPME